MPVSRRTPVWPGIFSVVLFGKMILIKKMIWSWISNSGFLSHSNIFCWCWSAWWLRYPDIFQDSVLRLFLWNHKFRGCFGIFSRKTFASWVYTPKKLVHGCNSVRSWSISAHLNHLPRILIFIAQNMVYCNSSKPIFHIKNS